MFFLKYDLASFAVGRVSKRVVAKCDERCVTWQRLLALVTPERGFYRRCPCHEREPNLLVTRDSGRRQEGARLSYLGLGEAHLVLSTHTTLIMCLKSLESWQEMAQKNKLQRVICAQRSPCTHTCRPTFTLQKSEDTQAAKPAGAGIKCESGHRSRWTDSLRRRSRSRRRATWSWRV